MEDHIEGNLLRMRVVQHQDKMPSYTTPINQMQYSSTIGSHHQIVPIRPSQFLEEKRWPPRGSMANHLKEKPAAFTCGLWSNAATPQPLLNQVHNTIPTGTNPRFSTLGPNIEPPFRRLEVIYTYNLELKLKPT